MRPAPWIAGKKPRELPQDLYADAGYNSDATRGLLRWLGIKPHIRYSKEQHGGHLGRIRWVVDRTISWIKGLRRMRVRYDRSGMTVNAWTSIAAAVVCFNILID